MTRFADLPCRQETVETGAAAEIDDSLARLHGGNRLRVAATEPEIGAVGNRRQLRLRIAHSARFSVRSGAAFQAAARRGGRLATARLARRRNAAVAGANHFLDLSVIHSTCLLMRLWSSLGRPRIRRSDQAAAREWSFGSASHWAISLPLSASNLWSSSCEPRMRSTRKLRKSFRNSHHAPSRVTST